MPLSWSLGQLGAGLMDGVGPGTGPRHAFNNNAQDYLPNQVS